MKNIKLYINKFPILKQILTKIHEIILKCFMFLSNKAFGVEERKIVFISFNGKSYSDNPRAISEKLHEANKNFEIIWIFKNASEKKKNYLVI